MVIPQSLVMVNRIGHQSLTPKNIEIGLFAFFTFSIPILHQLLSILTIHLFGILWFDCQPSACTII